jgi:hypothetical protein
MSVRRMDDLMQQEGKFTELLGETYLLRHCKLRTDAMLGWQADPGP